MQVEHEADQSSLEPRARAHVNGEACAGELGGAFQIENAESLAQFPVGLGGEVPCAVSGVGEVGPDDDVVGFGLSCRHFVAREVGDAGEREAKLLVKLGGGLVELVQFFLEDAGLVYQGSRVQA